MYMQQQQRLQESSPLTFLILASLVDEPKRATTLHEAVMQAGELLIEPGAFSRVVARMERRGWIVGYEVGEGLRSYQITDLGMLALQAHERSNQEQYERSPDGHRGKERMMPLVFWILRLYPPGWRERYEAEMVALLDQHHITLWTILDLLMGALDARLDPNYRRAHQLLLLKRFKSSWRLLVAGFVAFWIALLPWFWMSQLGIDDAQCSNWGTNYALCVMRKTVGAHQPTLSALVVWLILIFLPILLMIFTAMLVAAHGKKARIHVQLALAVTGSMMVFCIACGFWLAGIWRLLPQIGQFYPRTPAALLIGIVGMGLATVLAFGALARAAFALRDMEKATPKQEAPLPEADGFSSSTDQQQDDRYMEARSAEEEQQEIPMVLRASAPVQEEPTASFATASGTRKGAKVEWALLVGLVLLFIVPWPGLISGDMPDRPTLLSSWLLAVVVGLITAWLVKEPGKKWEQRTSRKPRRPISPLWWAVLLPAPSMTFFIFGIGPAGPRAWPLLLLACIVSGMAALIIKVRMNHPRIKSPRAVSWSVLALVIIFMVLGVSHIMFFPIESIVLLVNVASIVPAFFVRVPSRKQQAEGRSEQQDIGAGAAPKVVAWVLFFLVCNAVYSQISSALYLNQGQAPLPPWIGRNEVFVSILMVICLIPALVVKTQISNRWATGVREPAPNDISPKVWILALPIIFLMFLTQVSYILQPDFGNFPDVFITWLLTGVAALIILLAIRLGSGKRAVSPQQEPPQARMQVQG